MGDIGDTITHPWRNPIDYATLAFWFGIFLVVSFIVFDMLQILVAWSKSAVESAA